MALPSRDNVITLDYAVSGQPACIIETMALSSATLDYAIAGQPCPSFSVVSGIQNIFVKVAGAWKQAVSVYVKVSGAWKAVSTVGAKVGGVWKS